MSAAGDTQVKKKPIVIERRHTVAGMDPVGDVTFEPRDVVIDGAEGAAPVVMRGMMFPSFWTQQAVKITVAKYFRKRGVGGPDGHETHLLQVVGRICRTIGAAAKAQGIFGPPDSPEADKSAQALIDELTWLMVNQRLSFNSPVWFNMGLFHEYGIEGDSRRNWAWSEEDACPRPTRNSYERPAVSACFIQSVRDDLESIFDFAAREARVFRFGGGSGVSVDPLRSEDEPLSGGGTSSGTLSWLAFWDRGAGSTKSGGTTRRAATMRTMSMWHPDIVKFIDWKAREEEKIRVLLAAGYTGGVNGEAQRTVSGQNSNNSVRVCDEFMRAVAEDGPWSTRFVVGGGVAGEYRARDLLRRVAQRAWECADPGVQFDTLINDWHTVPNSGRINASNPCAEFLHLDDTACNLGSVNLLKYVLDFIDDDAVLGDGCLDIEGLRHAVRLMAVAMEAMVDMASYPTREIAQNSHDYRPLGIGYANLGALLMVLGLPYDSDAARAKAAAITAIMCGEAYETSARIAGAVGAFPGFEKNRDPMLRVMKKHLKASEAIDRRLAGDALADAAVAALRSAYETGSWCGYRNAQMTVLAPTGTISFPMDCDTTGIEPDFAVVRYKEFAGGGGMKQTNHAVPVALRRLGYDDQQVADVLTWILGTGRLSGAPHLDDRTLRGHGLTAADIEAVEAILPGSVSLAQAFAAHVLGADAVRRLGLGDHLDPSSPMPAWRKGFSLFDHWGLTAAQVEAASAHMVGHMTIEGAPHVRPEHLAVFDCANRCGPRGRRSISPDGHVTMVAAVQPFLSGAASKTINLPSDATVEDVERMIVLAHTLGVKCVSVYRDKSKAAQPLTTSAVASPAVGQRTAALGALVERTEPDRVPALLAATADHLHGLNRIAREGLGQPVRDLGEYESAVEAVMRTTATASPSPSGYAVRRRLPKKRPGFTQEARIGGHKVFLRTGEYADGRLGEVFLDMSKAGSGVRAMANAFAIAVSLGLQHGVNPAEYVDAFKFMRFEPQGVVQGDAHGIRFATSVVDYVARVIGVFYLDMTDLAHVASTDGQAEGVVTDGHMLADAMMDEGTLHHRDARSVAEAIDGPAPHDEFDHCPCGGVQIRTGRCLTCQSCGTSSGGCS